MINKLAFPIRVLLKKEDELHLKDSNTVHGWNVVHLIKTEVLNIHVLQYLYIEQCALFPPM